MKKLHFFISVLIVLFIVPIKSGAQEKSTADSTVKYPMKEESYGLISTSYNNDIVFLGRKSSLKAPYITAQAGFYHKSGLFINGAVSYLASSAEKRIDLFTPTVGYDFYWKKFSTGISVAKYFYNNKSYTSKSALAGSLNVYADYNFDIVEVYVNSAAYFSNTTDFILGLGVSHTFYTAGDNLKFIPSVYLNAGTQNYYGNYSNNNRFGRHMLDGGSSGSIRTGMMGGSGFNVLDYELSIPVSYTLNKFQFSFIPVFAIPVNAAIITNNQNTYKEDITNNFFWSLDLRYKLSKL